MKNAMSNGAMTSMVAADRMRLMIYRIMLFAESFFPVWAAKADPMWDEQEHQYQNNIYIDE